MDFQSFKSFVSSVSAGKALPDAIYIHESAVGAIPPQLSDFIFTVAQALKIPEDNWNIIKLFKRDFKVTLLNYPDFDTYAYPALHGSHTIDLSKLSYRFADYSDSENPPILHRKEAFVLEEHPLQKKFIEYTREGERIGLYEKPRIIGFKRNWEKLILSKGYTLDSEGRLCKKTPKIQLENTKSEEVIIERHKTAIDRNQLSQPMRILARHNYLNGNYSLLDYGCGKGDDVRELEAHGIDVSGWDPVHCPEGTLVSSDIVNLGFVLNVIEDYQERVETLERAWEYADSLLIVSVMIAGESLISQFRPYQDGVITSRNTFQKYYSQLEIRTFLEHTLKESAIAVSQGIYIVFKDKMEEQKFLLERQHVKRNWRQLTQREIQSREQVLKKDIIDNHIELFTDFWETCLDLGRVPANSEFELSDQIRRIAGSHNKAHQALVKHFGKSLFVEAEKQRKEDLIVYFALGLFDKRKSYIKMPDSLKRDIKFFFNSYSEALAQAKRALFSIADPKLIEDVSELAYTDFQHGEFNNGHSWIVHKKLLDKLPATLRIYVGCACQLYGGLDEIHLIKIHFTSGKVSLMRYDDWEKQAPRLEERIKIKLREQNIDFFIYKNLYENQSPPNKELYHPIPT